MIEDVRRFCFAETQCKTCYNVVYNDQVETYYTNGICGECRRHLPYYIPKEQEVRFLLALGKARKKWLIDG